jgi:ligand-binding sensor domain-containing protein/two-component sensor histidine kinase
VFHRIVEGTNGKFSLEEVEMNLPPNPSVAFGTTVLHTSRDKSLWAATNWGLLRILPDDRKIFYTMENLPANVATDIIEDSAGRIWLARALEFYGIKPETLEELQNFGALTVRRLEDAPEKTMVGAVAMPEKAGEIFRYSDLKDFRGAGTAKYLCETADKHVWVSAGFGAVEFDGSTFKPYTTEQGLFKASRHIVEDSAGNLWFGSPGGILRLDRDGLTTYDERDGLENLGISAVGETGSGQLYLNGDKFTVRRFNGARFDNVRPALPPETTAIWMARPVFQDSAGEWWFLSTTGLYRFAATDDLAALARQKQLAVYGKKDGFNSDSMFHIFEDSHKNLWISTRGSRFSYHGLAYWTRATEEFKFYTEADGFPPNKAVSAIAEDAQGNIWLGFYEGGLMRFSGGRFTDYTTPETSGLITALRVDRQNRLWIGSAINGVTCVENPAADEIVFQSYTTENGLTSNNVRSLTEDEFGRIYAGTARGVDRIATDTGRITHYTVNDGLAGDFVHAAYRARDGVLWFGTPNGLSRLVPRLESKIISPPVRLSGLRIAGESQPIPELGTSEISNLELQTGQNNLQIEFFGMDFSPNGALRYQYKLEGADKDWSQPTEQRTVNYANLSPGNYRFLVRAIGADGGLSPNPAAISFKILRPVWQRWWFLILATVVIVSLIYMLYSYRVAQLLKLERVRTRIATDLHDDIGSSLSQIAILSEVVRQKVGDNGANQPLNMIAETSREMVDSMSDIVWAINPDKDHLSDLIQRMRRFAGDMLDAKDITYKFIVPDAHRDITLGADIRREVYLIFKESINNLVKYAEATTVEMSALVENNHLVVKIKDDGRGFDAAEVFSGAYDGFGGNGLINMRRRTENLGGRFTVESERGNGTSVEIKIPI